MIRMYYAKTNILETYFAKRQFATYVAKMPVTPEMPH